MKRLFLFLAIIPLITGIIMGQRMVDQTNINIVDFQSLSPYQPNPVQNLSVGNGMYRGKVYKNGYPAKGIVEFSDGLYSGEFSQNQFGVRNGYGIYQCKVTGNKQKISEAYAGNWVNGQLEGRGLYMECVLSPIPDEGYVWRAYGVDYRNSRVVSALTPAAVPTEVCGVYFTAPSFNNQDDSHSSGYDKKKRSSEYNRHEAICKGCDGDGKCRKCNGKGYYPDGRKCTYCHTSGDCPNCGGVGKKYGFF